MWECCFLFLLDAGLVHHFYLVFSVGEPFYYQEVLIMFVLSSRLILLHESAWFLLLSGLGELNH